jgi:beta-1,4-mannosyl-glycoprotein beta-1,4-N-acetylglucosaminyltransferase
MVYDCLLFSNELKILKLRFGELNFVVDLFVLVEGTTTFTRRPQPLYFHQKKPRFQQYLHKIHHVIVDDMPERRESAWGMGPHPQTQFFADLRVPPPMIS